MPQVSDSPVSEMEEEEVLEEEMEKEKKTRPKFHPDNRYIFDTLDEAKEGQKNLCYTDESQVDPEAFRPFHLRRSEEGKETVSKGFILAKSSLGAAIIYLEDKGFAIGLAEPKSRGGGRGKSKIEQTIREYAITLACVIFGYKIDQVREGEPLNHQNFKPNADTHWIAQWEIYFGSDGSHRHYLDENGSLKDATS